MPLVYYIEFLCFSERCPSFGTLITVGIGRYCSLHSVTACVISLLLNSIVSVVLQNFFSPIVPPRYYYLDLDSLGCYIATMLLPEIFPKVIELLSCLTKLSMKFQLLIKIKMLKRKKKEFSCFQSLRCCIYEHA